MLSPPSYAETLRRNAAVGCRWAQVLVVLAACSSDPVAPSAPDAGSAGASAADGGKSSASDAAAEEGDAAGAAGRTADGSHAAGAGGAGDCAPSASSESAADGGERCPAPQPPAAGTSGQAGSGASKEPNAHEISGKLADAFCAALTDCLGPQKVSALLGREPCATRVGGDLEQSELAGLDDSIGSGRIQLHAELLAQCYADTRAFGCKVQTDRLPGSCQQALAGQVALGGTCSIGSECQGDAFCRAGECPRTCDARLAEGSPCRRDDECKVGTFCNAGTCAVPAAVGAACGGETGAVCAFGSSCVGSTDSEPGECKSNREIQSGELGDVCTPGGTLCREGLNCAYDGDSGFECQAAVSAGAACHLALPGQCPVDQYCDAKDVSTEGQCKALPGDGTACVLSDECAPRHICVLENDEPVCRRIGDLGDSCAADGLCRSNHCDQGQCKLEPACN
jgi:hypothetical protein